MKSKTKLQFSYFSFFLIFFFFNFLAEAQIFEMSASVIFTCDGSFTDSGGMSGDYSSNKDITATICSADTFGGNSSVAPTFIDIIKYNICKEFIC